MVRMTKDGLYGEPNRPYKPHGFWKRPEVVAEIESYIAGGVSEEQAARKLECRRQDVRWHAAHDFGYRGGARQVERVAIGEGGRIVIPASYRQALNLNEGDEIILQLADGELRLLTAEEALRRAQELVRRYVPAGRSLAEELIEERRQEARRERSGG